MFIKIVMVLHILFLAHMAWKQSAKKSGRKEVYTLYIVYKLNLKRRKNKWYQTKGIHTLMKQRIQLTRFKQEIGLKVGDMMTRKLILANPDTSVDSCVKKMLENKVGTVLVTDKDKLMGIISKLDILRLIPRKLDLSKVKAKEIMTRNVRTIKPEVDLYQAIILSLIHI